MTHSSDGPELVSLWPDPDALGTATDLYQLTMMAGYHAVGCHRARAVFELFVRRLPRNRAYLVVAGLEQALRDLFALRFSEEQVDYLRALPMFSHVDATWFEHLARLRFSCDVWAMPEGTIAFAGEPLVRVEGPLEEAQLVETYLIAALSYPTLVASKAARCVDAAAGRPLFDFGARRGHGPHAGFLAARAAYLAGFAGTSHVEAGRRLSIPVTGTMAHSWVQTFPDEPTAFAAFSRTFPGRTTLLVDTYDVERGVEFAAAIEPAIKAVRIDSGDLAELARRARTILDRHGRNEVQIIVSGDLDETKVDALVASGAPIDAFGIGTELITGGDAPSLSMVYKLVEINGVGKSKLSPGKKTYPNPKQVYRRRDGDGRFAADLVTRADAVEEGEPLLVAYARAGDLIRSVEGLSAAREHCFRQMASRPDDLRGVHASPMYPVTFSATLESKPAGSGTSTITAG